MSWEYQPEKIPRVGRLDLDNASLEAISQLKRPNSCRRLKSASSRIDAGTLGLMLGFLNFLKP